MSPTYSVNSFLLIRFPNISSAFSLFLTAAIILILHLRSRFTHNNVFTREDPINPVAPVTKTVFPAYFSNSISLYAISSRSSCCFESLAYSFVTDFVFSIFSISAFLIYFFLNILKILFLYSITYSSFISNSTPKYTIPQTNIVTPRHKTVFANTLFIINRAKIKLKLIPV